MKIWIYQDLTCHLCLAYPQRNVPWKNLFIHLLIFSFPLKLVYEYAFNRRRPLTNDPSITVNQKYRLRMTVATDEPGEKWYVSKPKAFAKAVWFHFFTYDGLIGDVDYAYLFRPTIPFTKWNNSAHVFFGLNERLPTLLSAILGLQHCMAMAPGLASTALLLQSYLQLSSAETEYIISATFITAGIFSAIMIARVPIPFTKRYIGTGMISVLGMSPTIATILDQSLTAMYNTGFCPLDSDGNKLPCPDAYGAALGTCAVCGLFVVLLSFLPPRIISKIFPHIVTGPVVVLIGLSLALSGVKDFGGGTSCYPHDQCNTGTSQVHPWGSGQFIGLGFSVIITIVLFDKFGGPLMKSCATILGLIVGCIIAAATKYFSHESIDEAPSGQFLWTTTFKLTVYGPLVLPCIALVLILAAESVGDITATAQLSQLPLGDDGEEHQRRVRDGLLAAGLTTIFGGLLTTCANSSYSQNNGIIAITQTASRSAGFYCAWWLFLMGIVGKFSAAMVAIPKAVFGGLECFLFTSISVAGLGIIGNIQPFTRRDRMVLTIELLFGFASLLVPTWFDDVFLPSAKEGSNTGLSSFVDSIITVVETPYAISAVSGIAANFLLSQHETVVEEEDLEGKSLSDVETGVLAVSKSTPA